MSLDVREDFMCLHNTSSNKCIYMLPFQVLGYFSLKTSIKNRKRLFNYQICTFSKGNIFFQVKVNNFLEIKKKDKDK